MFRVRIRYFLLLQIAKGPKGLKHVKLQPNDMNGYWKISNKKTTSWKIILKYWNEN